MKTFVIMGSTTTELNRQIEDLRTSLYENEEIVDVEVTPIVRSEEKTANKDGQKFIRYNYIFMAVTYVDSEEL